MTRTRAEQGIAVIVLAGKRIDTEDSETPRFPLDHVDAVKAEIRKLFRRLKPQALVCSAANGADLLGLDVARELQLPAYVVLPFDREQFRESSVVDRRGDWGSLFDDLVDKAEREGRLTVMEPTGDNHDAYLDAVGAMLDKAAELSGRTADGQPATSPGTVTTVVVWNGESRGSRDVTVYFISEAQKRGFASDTIAT
jgi:hypothetical protein